MICGSILSNIIIIFRLIEIMTFIQSLHSSIKVVLKQQKILPLHAEYKYAKTTVSSFRIKFSEL